MRVRLRVRNESDFKRLYRSDSLRARAMAICQGEGLQGSVELSVLFCGDAFIRELNRHYRDVDEATDVLAFEQEGPAGVQPRPLGDIVISLETVAAHCRNDRAQMRNEVDLLFCHGLLHLFGYDHDTAEAKNRMQLKQSHYLGASPEDAWRFGPRPSAKAARPARRRRTTSLGR